MSDPKHDAILVIPRIRVQNANAISSALTWGFPSISAFTGLSVALERKLGRSTGIAIFGVGVICHDFEAQVTNDGFTNTFNLTRNPVDEDGSTASIVEEGRIHLEISLVFDVRITTGNIGDEARSALAERMADTLQTMRIAGGSVLPARSGRRHAPHLSLVLEGEMQRTQFNRIMRGLLPGFALVCRDKLLASRLEQLRQAEPNASVLDAWLDLSRWNYRAERAPTADNEDAATWVRDKRDGWIVPIPVGYTAISPLYAPGEMRNTRDASSHARFVEPIWTVGQWVSPHRLSNIEQLKWFSDFESGDGQLGGLYRCRNDYENFLNQ